jgi:hypothetical protein
MTRLKEIIIEETVRLKDEIHELKGALKRKEEGKNH